MPSGIPCRGLPRPAPAHASVTAWSVPWPSTCPEAPSTPGLGWLRGVWEVLSCMGLWDVHPALSHALSHPAQPVKVLKEGEASALQA